MNEIQTLIKEFGSYRKLATVMGITAPALTNMQNKGRRTVPPKYNDVIMRYAREHMDNETVERVRECLDHACPACGRPY